jgi:hypothetical protein
LSSRTLLLYSQSGAGKSSLVNAGLLPLVEAEHFDVLPPARVQGVLPAGSSVQQPANPYTFFTLTSWDATPGDNATNSLVDALRVRPRSFDRFGDPAGRLVVIDQFEELFTSFPEAWQRRADFVVGLADALTDDPRLHVLLCLREDHLADLLSLADLFPDHLETRYRLSQLRAPEATEAIVSPLEKMGCAISSEVATALVDDLMTNRVETQRGEAVDVRGEFVEPVQLQVVCSSIWRSLPVGATEITADHVRRSGGVTESLAQFYDDVVLETSKRTRVSTGSLRRWFGQALITPSGTRGILYRGRDTTADLPNRAVDVLENLHMIRAEPRAGARWYELTHDRFIAPIRSSNARALRESSGSWWGIVPLTAGVLLAIALTILAPSGWPWVAVCFVSGLLAGLGAGQLLGEGIDRQRRQRIAVSEAKRGRRIAGRVVVLAVAAICALAAVAILLSTKPEEAEGADFSAYASSQAGLNVLGMPSCGGGNLAVQMATRTPDISEIQVTDPVWSDAQLTKLAQSWCRSEARTNILYSVVWMAFSVLFLAIVVVPRRRRRRRAHPPDRRTPSIARSPAAWPAPTARIETTDDREAVRSS